MRWSLKQILSCENWIYVVIDVKGQMSKIKDGSRQAKYMLNFWSEMDKLKYGQYRSKVLEDQNMDHKSKPNMSKDHHDIDHICAHIYVNERIICK